MESKGGKMGFVNDINFKIKGQVSGEGRDYDVIRAKLEVICAEYDLNLQELYPDTVEDV
jgi:hypothetical protein